MSTQFNNPGDPGPAVVVSKPNSPVGSWPEATRGRGNTRHLVHAASRVGGVIVVPTRETAAYIRSYKDHPVRIVTMGADDVDHPGPVFVDVSVVQELMRINDELRQKLAAAQIGPTLSADAIRSGNMELYWAARRLGWAAPEKYHDSGSKLLDGWQDDARKVVEAARAVATGSAPLAPTSAAVLQALANARAYELLKPFGYPLGKVLAEWIAAGCPDGVDTPEAGSVLEFVQDLITDIKQET